MSLSPAAAALEADLCLLTRLPLPKEADLNDIKERVFGSVEGVPRTEDASRRRYVDAIVLAFDAAGVHRIEQLPEEVRRLVKRVGTVSAERDRLMAALHKFEGSYGTRTRERDDALANIDHLLEANKRHVAERDEARSEVRRLQAVIDEQGTEHEDVSDDLRRVREEYDAVRHERDDLREACETMRQERDKAIRWHDENVAERNAMRQERDEARAVLAKARERVERLQEINKQLETRNREATQAGAYFGVETCGLLAEKDAEIERLRAEHKDLVIVRRRIIDVESEGNRLRTENAKLKDSAHALITERDRLATRVREHEETLAVLRNVNADLFKAQQYLREARDESKRWHDYSVSLNAKLEKTEQDLASTRAAHAEITAAHAKLAADVTHKDRLMRDLNNALTRAREEAKTAHAALTAEQGRSDRLRAVMVDLIADLNAAKEGAA